MASRTISDRCARGGLGSCDCLLRLSRAAKGILKTTLGLCALLAVREAHAECLSGGAINICEDPITGKTPGTTWEGGTILSGQGFRVDQLKAHLSYDLGAIVDTGKLRFSVSGIGEEQLKTADSFLLLNLTDEGEPVGTPPHLIEIKIWGYSATDPSASGKIVLGLSDVVHGTGVQTSKAFSWDQATTYEMEVAWSAQDQRVSLQCNGALVAEVATDKKGATDMAYRYAHLAPYINKVFVPVVGSVYGMFSVAADGASGGAGGAAGSDAGGAGTGGATALDAATEVPGDSPVESEGQGGFFGTGGTHAAVGGRGGTPAGASIRAPEGESGCGCRLTGQASQSAVGWWIGVAWCAWRVQRQRRRSRSLR